ncbi:MAG TPA: lamin tail domain-containing protein [Verrucomicrobiales bacterium]|nr:lamin tail domain-containing protein [Verrucomicrobiales bacterium]
MRHTQATLVALACLSVPVSAGQVVFSEVMYHPTGTKPEFIEAINLTSNRIDMATWRLHGGVNYTFPGFNPAATAAHFLREYERIVISSADEATTRAAYPTIPPFVRVYGPWTGSLNNAGDTIILDDAAASRQCSLTYGDRGKWPVAADGTGHSLLLINQDREIDDWRNWRQSTVNGGTPGNPEIAEAETPIVGNQELSVVDYVIPVNYTSPWKYWRDAADPDGANPEGTWKGTGFVDTAWPGPGNGFFGHEPSTPALSATIQTSFSNLFVSSTMTYYFRTTFNWTGPTTGTDFVVDQFVDDGVIYWLNGVELKGPNLGRVRMNAGTAAHGTGATTTPGTGDAFDEQGALSGSLDGQLVAGTNVLCAEVHQSGSGSSDIYFGARLKIGVPPTASVVINEVKPSTVAGQGFVEFYNPTGAAVDLNGWYLSDSPATPTKFQITSPLVVPSLGFATVGFVESSLTLANPVVILLTRPDGTTKQTGVSITNAPTDGRTAGRKPAGAAQWFMFSTPTPGSANQSSALGSQTVRLSEAHFNPLGRVDWVEFGNPTASTLSGTGLFVASKFDFSDKVALPASVPGNGYASAAVDFAAEGDGSVTLFLIDSSNAVLDSAELNHRTGLDSVQRYPLSRREWYNASTATQNLANNPARHEEIVINEIMAAPPSGHEAGEFVELYNRSGGTVNLTGWRFVDGASFDFPPGTTLGAGQYLVLAKDPAFIAANYTGVTNVYGPFSGVLRNGGEMIRLEDERRNVADTVDYNSGGQWPVGADGGGSSLELMHPDMDNSQPSAWRASDESNKSTFQNFTHTGVYRELRGVPAGVTACRELLISLVSDGHVVMKNMSLTRAAAPATNQMTGGDATSHGTGTSVNGLLCTGTHCLSDTQADGFHLISFGSGDTKANKAEVDVIGIVAGDTLTFSFNGRWVSGMPLVVVQTWDRSFGKVFRLPIPNNLGTPGAANTKAIPSAAPVVDNIKHAPPVPTSTQSVIVSARVSSPTALTSVSLVERIDNVSGNGTWNTTAMNDSGTGGDAVAGDGIWSATVLQRGDGTITQFYVTASNGQTNECPRSGATRPAMWIVDNSPPTGTPGTLIQRFIISLYHRNALNEGTGFSAAYDWDHQRMSNFGWNATMIFNERDVIYNGELRRGGSPWTRTGANTLDRARWKTPADNAFRARNKSGTDNDSAGASRFHNRMVRYMMYLVADYPSPDSEFIQQIINGDAPRLGDDQEQTDTDFFNRAYADLPQGELFEIDDAWFMYDSNLHNERIAADSVTGRWSLKDWNNSTDAFPSAESPIFFHGNFPLRFPEDKYDYAALSSLVRTAFNNNTSVAGMTPALQVAWDEQMSRQIDVWRAGAYAAVRGYIGDWDNFTLNRGKNGYFYRRPTDGKFEFHHWDSDLGFSVGEAFIGGTGGVGWTNLTNRPMFRRAYNFYLHQLVSKYTRNSARMDAFLTAMNYQSAVGDALAPFKTSVYNYPSFWSGREAAAINSINSFGGNNYTRPFSVTTANNQTVSTPLFTVTGEAPANVWTVAVDGHPEALFAWTGTITNVSQWTISNIALASGQNSLTIRGLAKDGTVMFTANLNVTLTGSGPPVPVLTSDPASRNVSANELLVFDGTGSFDPEGTPLTYGWSVTPATGHSIAHSVPGKSELLFFTPGSYSVTMTVTDGASNTANITREVTVYNTNDFNTFGTGAPLGPDYTVQNIENRDNYSASAWYSVEDATGRLLMHIMDDSAKPLTSPAFTHPLITKDLPDTADFVLQTALTPDTRQFGPWQSGLWLEINEAGTNVRYAFSLEGGLSVTVKRASQPSDYTQAATLPVTGAGAILRVKRNGTSLVFQNLANSVWTTVYTQTIPANSTALTGGIFAATSMPVVTPPAVSLPITFRVAFDYFMIADSSNTNSVLSALRVTEIMFNPAGEGGIEFIELTNTGNLSINIGGVYFEQGKPIDQFTFPSHVMPPGAFVIVTNVTPAAFYAAYPTTPPGIVFQWPGGSLNNSGEQVTTRDSEGNIIQDFAFDDDPLTNWPTQPDGGGVSLEITNTNGDYNSGLNWHAGTDIGGSPGRIGTGADSDGDGYPDSAEQIAGTNPANAGDFLTATSQYTATGEKISLTVQPGRVYHIDTCESIVPASWVRRSSYTHPAASPAQPKDFIINVPPVATTRRLFYRVVVEMAP